MFLGIAMSMYFNSTSYIKKNCNLNIKMNNIDEFLLSLKQQDIIEVNDYKSILLYFIAYPKLKAIKYKQKFFKEFDNSLISDYNDFNHENENENENKKYFIYEIPKKYIDIISNITCFINDKLTTDVNLLFHNYYKINCNIYKLTLPICNLIYCTIYLCILLSNDYKNIKININYDIYTLNLNIRNNLKKKMIVNNEGLVFYEGTFDGYL